MGHSRGGLTTKIHALVDAEGRPVRLQFLLVVSINIITNTIMAIVI